jgi:putative spermidine/putrescine transport system substrate-binding protein
MARTFFDDAVEMASATKPSRREFGRSLLAAAAAGLFPVDSARAADRFVVANWGGDAVPAFQTVYAPGCKAATGSPLVVDGSGPSEGAVRTQVASRAVRWDVCDGEMYSSYRLGKEGLLEPLDYSVVKKELVRFGDIHPFGIANYSYSYVIAYDKRQFGGNPPRTWADFYDVKKFPGKRSLYKWMSGTLETALLADGIPPDKLYPLDVDRALKRIAALKPHIATFWATGAENQQIFFDGEVVMAQTWNTRAELLKQDTKGRIDWSYDNGILSPSVWFVPKGNPAGRAAAMKFIAMAQEPRVQARLMEVYKMGPVNPAANDLLSPELRALNPTAPANAAKQMVMNNLWYAERYGAVLDRYLALIAG